MVMAASVVRVSKMANIVPRVGIEPTSLAFRVSVLPLPLWWCGYVTTIPTPTCLWQLLASEVNADYNKCN